MQAAWKAEWSHNALAARVATCWLEPFVAVLLGSRLLRARVWLCEDLWLWLIDWLDIDIGQCYRYRSGLTPRRAGRGGGRVPCVWRRRGACMMTCAPPTRCARESTCSPQTCASHRPACVYRTLHVHVARWWWWWWSTIYAIFFNTTKKYKCTH